MTDDEKYKYEKICPICGETFHTNRLNRKYCSFRCSGEAKYMRDLKYYHDRYHNDEQFRKKRLEDAKERRKENREKIVREVTQCVICGQKIPNTRPKNAVTCSKECSKSHSKNNKKKWEKAHPNGKANMAVEKKQNHTKAEKNKSLDVIISEECGIPCSECEREWCPY